MSPRPSPDTSLAVAREAWEVTAPEALEPSRALDAAALTRPAVRAARERAKAARQAVALARAEFAPRIVVDGGYGWRDDRFLPRDPDWAAGVAAEIPIFSGLSSVHGVARAKAEQAREEAEVRRLTLAVGQEVWMADSRLRESYEAVKATDALVTEARENLQLAQGRYEEGAGTLTDLLDAEVALTRAEASRTEARWDYHVAKAALRWALGDLTAGAGQ